MHGIASMEALSRGLLLLLTFVGFTLTRNVAIHSFTLCADTVSCTLPHVRPLIRLRRTILRVYINHVHQSSLPALRLAHPRLRCDLSDDTTR